MKTVAIVGAGPAGCACAITLAEAGVRALLFERQPEREKPCGGGLTGRAFRAMPRLLELDLPWVNAHEFEVVGPTGRSALLKLESPIRIVSRQLLDTALRREAIRVGAALIREPVREFKPRPGKGWQVNDHAAEVLVGAGGMTDPVARHQQVALARSAMALAIGRFVPGSFPPRIICRFFPDQRGYAWWFPREDHASFGLEIIGEGFDREMGRRLLDQFAAENLKGVDVSGGETYGWSGPAVLDWMSPKRTYGGADWMLVGDAAGLADVTTGEGLSYAMASGVLAARSILQGDVPGYSRRLHREIVPELAKSARLQPKFYRTWFLRLAILALSRSRTCRTIAGNVAHGGQSYLTLKKKVYQEMPRMAMEMLVGT